MWRTEGLGCPGPTGFLDAPPIKWKFSFVTKNFWRPFLFVNPHLSLFLQLLLSCMPSLKTFFLLFFAILKHFYTLFKKKTGLLDAPRLDARAVAPPRTPLHAMHCIRACKNGKHWRGGRSDDVECRWLLLVSRPIYFRRISFSKNFHSLS